MKKRVFLLLLAWFMIPGVAFSNPKEDLQRAERIAMRIQDCATQSDANKIWKKLFEKETESEDYNKELIIRANRAAEQLEAIEVFWDDIPEGSSEKNLHENLCKDLPSKGTLGVYNSGIFTYLHSSGDCFGDCFDMLEYIELYCKKSGKFDLEYKHFQKKGESCLCVLKQKK